MNTVYFDKRIFRNNIDILREWSDKRGISLSFMIKWQLLQYAFLRFELLKSDVKVYTTKDDIANFAVNIYNNESTVIVDAVDKREGIEMKDIDRIKDKEDKLAVVNFYCGNHILPTPKKVDEICNTLKKSFGGVSLGGSMMLWFDNKNYDEVRIGECLLTGYSTVFDRFYEPLQNPFKIEVPIWANRYGRVLVNTGFLSFGGFTNIKPVCVNTDITVFNERDIEWSNKIGHIILRPDYFTLIKMANNNELNGIITEEK